MSLWLWKRNRDRSQVYVIASSIVMLLIIGFVVVRAALFFWYVSMRPDLALH